MARDDDRDRVASVGQADRARRRIGVPQASGDLPIGRGLTVLDLQELVPDPLLEVGPVRIEGQVELGELPGEGGRQLARRLDQDGVVPSTLADRTIRRSEDRRGGRECVSMCSSGWSLYPKIKLTYKQPTLATLLLSHY